MMILRCLCLLLVPLLAVGGVGMSGDAMVLCIADTHIAVEATNNLDDCSDSHRNVVAVGNSAVAPDSDCVDVGLGTSDQCVTAKQRGTGIPQFLPLPLAAFLSPPTIRCTDATTTAQVVWPPPHLHSLRTFVLLT